MNSAFYRGFIDELQKLATTAPTVAPGPGPAMGAMRRPARPPTAPPIATQPTSVTPNFPGQTTTVPSSMGGMNPQPVL